MWADDVSYYGDDPPNPIDAGQSAPVQMAGRSLKGIAKPALDSALDGPYTKKREELIHE
jgi:hypothetical protein